MQDLRRGRYGSGAAGSGSPSLALKLIPESWPEPGKGRRRKLGPDGVLEVCLGCRAWERRSMQVRSRSQSADAKLEGNSHNMTEASLELGRLAFDFHSVLTALAQSNMFGDLVAANSDDSPTASTSVPSLDDGDFGDGAHAGAWKRVGAKQLRRARRGGRGPPEVHGKVAKDGPSALASSKVELQRRPALVRQAARASILALALSFGVFCGAVAHASGSHDRPGSGWSEPRSLPAT